MKGDAILVFRMFWLHLLGEVVARRKRIPRPDLVVEHPEDPSEYMGDGEEKFPSLCVWPEMEYLARLLRLVAWQFDQGPLGHPRRKPTRIMSTMACPPELHGLRGPSTVFADEVAFGQRRGRHGHLV